MSWFPSEIIRTHLKLDEDVSVEDGLIAQYLKSAVSICEDYCGRRIYLDETERQADRDAARIDWAAARSEYDQMVEDADGEATILHAAEAALTNAQGEYIRRVVGIVANDTVKGAILMVLGHLYKNRQEVVVSQYSGATQLPAGARKILERYLYIASGVGGS